MQPPAGYGFTGEACYLGGPGNSVDLLNTKITGWGAEPAAFATSGVGLRLSGGTQARITGCEITGGDGVDVAGYAAGGAAVTNTGVGPVQLRIDGNSVIQGGDGANAAGGNGVAIQLGSIEVGAATVSGGFGVPPGVAYPFVQPTIFPIRRSSR